MNTASPTARIDVADVLRGIAIAGIIMIHSLEHFNFWYFLVEPTALDKAVWDTVFYLFAGKMYAIFALLFGLSCFIQHHNAEKRGVDFRGRFAWRMFLLFLISIVNCCLYNGDILMTYALLGLCLIPFVKMNDRWLVLAIVILGLQPIELGYIIAALINPAVTPLNLDSASHFYAIIPALAEGTFWEACRDGLIHGAPANILWALEKGRFTQTLFLFLLGMWVGRRRLFYNEGNNQRIWKRVLLLSVVAFVPLALGFEYLPDLIAQPVIKGNLRALLEMWRNLSMMLFIVTGILLLFYNTSFRRVLMIFSPYGKMSLTNYVGQSLIGGALFYHWGFGLFRVCGHTVSLLIGLGIIVLQIIFCHYWMKHHRRGPLEELWRRATDIKIK